MFKKVWKEFLAIPLSLLMVGNAFAQGPVVTIQGLYNGTTIKPIAVDSSGNLVLSGTITGGNGAASNTGSGVPAQAGYTGGNVGGTLRGITATNTTGSVYGLDVNIVGGAGAGGTSSTVGAAVPATATAGGQSDGTNLQVPRVFDADSGAGTQYVQGVQLRVSGSGGSTEIGSASAPIRTDPTGTTSQPVTQATGTNLHTVLDSGTLTTVTTVTTVGAVTAITNALPAGTNVIGHVIADSGSTTAVTGNVTAVSATAANLKAEIVGTKSNNGGTPGATNLGVLPAVANTSAPSYTDTDQVALSTDLNGALRVNVVSGSTGNAAAGNTGSGVPSQADYTGGNVGGTLRGITATNTTGSIYALDVNIAGGAAAGGTSSNFGSAVPSAGTASGLSDGTNMQSPRVFDGDSGGGTQYITGVMLRQTSNGGSIEIGSSANPIRNDPTGVTAQPVTNAGTFAVQDAILDGAVSSSRVQVNPISGQTGVQGASGTVSNTTQRVVLATDVALPAGTNVIGHIIADTGSTTAVTQATASNLNAQVVGAAASGASKAGNPVQTGGVFNTTQPTVTNGQAVENQATARGAQIVATGVDTFNVTVNAALPAGTALIGVVGNSQGSTTSGQSGPLIQGAVTTGSPSYTTAQTSPLSLDTSGNLRVNVVAGSTGNTAASATGSAVPASADYTGLNVSGTLRGQTGTNTSGSVYAADINVVASPAITYNSTQPTLANGQTEADFQIGSRGGLIVTTGSDGFTLSALPTGTNMIGHVIADTGSTTAVTGNVTVVQSTNTNLKADVTSNAQNIATETSLVKLPVAQGSTTSGQSGPLSQGAVTTAAPSYSNAQTSPLSLTTAGLLRVDNSGVTQPVSGSLTTVSTVTNLAQMNGAAITMGNGASGTGVQRVTLANDSTGIVALTTGSAQIGHLEANQSANIAQINGVTVLMGNGVTGTGSQRITIASDNTAFSVNATESLATSGGETNYNVEPGASDNHVNIKNGAGQVYSITAFSKHTAAQYIRLYNAASGFNGCNSATNLIWSGIIPGAATGAGFSGVTFPGGLAFGTGISICVTGAYGQTDTTSATASVMEVNVGYK